MIRLSSKTSDADRRPLRAALGMPESSGSVFGSTTHKRAISCPFANRLYQLGVRKSGPKSEALDFGDAFHLVLEAYYRALQRGDAIRDATALAWTVLDPLRSEPGYSEILLTLESCLASYFEYALLDPWKVVAVEEELVYRGIDFDYSARLDLVYVDTETNELWIGEHKSTKAITDDMMSGYLLDLQTLGQAWLMRECVDLTRFPPFAGVCVNITSKQKTPKHERVKVRFSEAHLAQFEKHMRLRTKMQQYSAEIGYPKHFGNCAGPAQYFKRCDFFDICHGQPDFDIAGVDKLTTDDVPFGFVVGDTATTEPNI